MTSNNKQPKLRLQGFTDEWEETTLGEVCDIVGGERITQQNNSGSLYPVYGGGGVSFRTDKFNKEDKLVISRFAISLECVRFIKGKFWLLDSGLSIDVKNNNIEAFINYYIYCIQPSIYLTARGVAQKNVDVKALKLLPIFLPKNLHEQQAIATLFTTLDNHISLLQCQLKAYQDYKKSMLQKLFPNKDSKTPQLRLKGFSDDWKETTLGDVFNEISEKNFPDKQVLMASQSSGIIPHDNSQRSIIRSKDNLSGYKLVKAGDFVISLRSFEGGFEYSNCEGIISPAYVILRNKVPISSYYFKQYFKSDAFINNYILKNMNLSLRDGKTISYKEASKYNLLLPFMPEQEAIATLFTNLDNYITNLSIQLELYNKKKKALLKNIFPSI